jgi:hypothetical protein
MAQSSSSQRVVTLVAVSGGNVYIANAGGVGWGVVPNNTAFSPPLVSSGLVRSDSNNQKLWFADGTYYCYFDPSIPGVQTWAASQGILPVGSDNGTPRLICTWRGRTVLSGLVMDSQNWFMSAVGDPTNFNYNPTPVVATQAVDGNNSTLGKVGDVITTLIPYSDDILIFGGDHSIYMMTGDPMAGGQLMRISDSIGMAWGIPWAKDPYGAVYFVSNRMGIYTMTPGQSMPQRISQQIEQPLQLANTGTATIRLLWDDPWQGLHVYVTTSAAQGAATHFFWEQRTGAWWEDQYPNNMNPQCCCVFDGNTPGDRHPLIGAWDGFVRQPTPTATNDDGTAISSSVMLGPLATQNLDDVLFKDMQAHLASGSSSVSYSVYVGTTAEIALASGAVVTGTWQAGRNANNFVRRSGHACWVGITATAQWAFEALRCSVAGKGKVRRRRGPA